MAVLVFLSAFLPGCSDEAAKDRPATIPVSGVVMYKGDPVAGATVAFMAEGAPRAATGVTNDKGEFKLSTFGANDGAVAGKHKITVTKVEGGSAPSSPDAIDEAAMNDPAALSKQMSAGETSEDEGPKSLIPKKYDNFDTTPLSEEVKAGSDNQFVLQLTD